MRPMIVSATLGALAGVLAGWFTRGMMESARRADDAAEAYHRRQQLLEEECELGVFSLADYAESRGQGPKGDRVS